MPLRHCRQMKRSSLPTIQEEPTPVTVLSRSLPTRFTDDTSPRQPTPTPLSIPRRHISSEESSSTSTWGTMSTQYCPSDEDECAILDDDDEEFGPPNSPEPLTFPRSPPRLLNSLSLIGLMLDGAKELPKRPRNPSSSGSLSPESECDSEILQMVVPRRRRARRRRTMASSASLGDTDADATTDVPDAINGRDTVGAGGATEEEKTTEEADTDMQEETSFWNDVLEHVGGYNWRGW